MGDTSEWDKVVAFWSRMGAEADLDFELLQIEMETEGEPVIDRTIYNWCVNCNMSYSPEAVTCPRCKMTPEEQQKKVDLRREAMTAILDRAWKKEGP